MSTYQILIFLFGVLLTVNVLPTVLNSSLRREVKWFLIVLGLVVYTALNFSNFIIANAFILAALKSLSLAGLTLIGAAWMAKVYRENEAKKAAARQR